MIDIILTSAISLITGAGSILLFFPQIRKSKIIENNAAQSQEWMKLYKEEKDCRENERKQWDAERAEYDQKIDSLYERISKHRDEKAEMTKSNTKLEVENTRLCLLKCEIPACPNRKPPTGF